jgi:hypothetical protein
MHKLKYFEGLLEGASNARDVGGRQRMDMESRFWWEQFSSMCIFVMHLSSVLGRFSMSYFATSPRVVIAYISYKPKLMQ